MKILVFTDLDGTLLDHHTYSVATSKGALNLLHQKGIPVVFCSSKTFDEQLFLQKKLGINLPFIIENGSAIVLPTNYFPDLKTATVQISETHSMIVLAEIGIKDIINELRDINNRQNNRLYGYADATSQEIGTATSLKGTAIQRAKNRWFTETLFSEPPNNDTISMLENAGFVVSQGGRFLTLQDKTIDKGKAVNLVAQLFENFWGEKPYTIGIGDSPNDASMLKIVDKPFLVQKTNGNWASMEVNGLTKIDGIGPKGFLAMTNNLIAMLV